MSHVFTCASVPTHTSIIKLSINQFSTSIHYRDHTTSQQPNHKSNCHQVVTSSCCEKQSRFSRTTSSLQRRISTTRAFQPEPTRCSENNTHCNKCSLSQLVKTTTFKTHFTIHHLSLLIAARAFLRPKAHKAKLTHCSEFQPHCSEFHQLSKHPRLSSTQTTCYKFYFVVDVKLHLPCSRKSPSFAREMLHALGTIDGSFSNFYNKVHLSIAVQHHIQHSRLHFIILKHILKQNPQLYFKSFPNLLS